MVSETMIGDTFRTSQFIIRGFAVPFKFDRTDKRGSTLFYIRDIPSTLPETPYIYDHAECLQIEINLHNTKWLLICSCNPLKSNIVYHLNSPRKILDYNQQNMIELS